MFQVLLQEKAKQVDSLSGIQNEAQHLRGLVGELVAENSELFDATEKIREKCSTDVTAVREFALQQMQEHRAVAQEEVAMEARRAEEASTAAEAMLRAELPVAGGYLAGRS